VAEQSDTNYTFGINVVGAEASQKALAETKAAEAALVKSSKELGASSRDAERVNREAAREAAKASKEAAKVGKEAADGLNEMQTSAKRGGETISKLGGLMSALGVDTSGAVGSVVQFGGAATRAFGAAGGAGLVLGGAVAAAGFAISELVSHVKNVRALEAQFQVLTRTFGVTRAEVVASAQAFRGYAGDLDIATVQALVVAGKEAGLTSQQIVGMGRAASDAAAIAGGDFASGFKTALGDIHTYATKAEATLDALIAKQQVAREGKGDEQVAREAAVGGSKTDYRVELENLARIQEERAKVIAQSGSLSDVARKLIGLRAEEAAAIGRLGTAEETYTRIKARARENKTAELDREEAAARLNAAEESFASYQKAAAAAKARASEMEALQRAEIARHEKLDATEAALLQKEVERVKFQNELHDQSLAQEIRRREQWKAMQADTLAAGVARGVAAGEQQQGKNDATLATFDTSALDSLLAATGQTSGEIEKLKQEFMDMGTEGAAAFGAIGAAAEAGSMVASAALGALSQAIQESLTENRYATELTIQGYEDRLAASDSQIAQLQKERDAATTSAERDNKIAAIKRRELELRRKAEVLTAKDTKAAESERLAAVLASMAAEAGTRAIVETALGIAAAATPGMQGAAAGHFAAAGLLAGVAVTAGAAASSISSGRNRSGQEQIAFEDNARSRKERAEGRAAEGDERRREAATRNAASENAGPRVTINVVGPYMTGEAVGEAVDKALKLYEGVK